MVVVNKICNIPHNIPFYGLLIPTEQDPIDPQYNVLCFWRYNESDIWNESR